MDKHELANENEIRLLTKKHMFIIYDNERKITLKCLAINVSNG